MILFDCFLYYIFIWYKLFIFNKNENMGVYEAYTISLECKSLNMTERPVTTVYTDGKNELFSTDAMLEQL